MSIPAPPPRISSGIQALLRHHKTHPDQLVPRNSHLADILPEPVLEVDLSGILTYANLAALSSFGLTTEDIKKSVSSLDLVVPEEKERALGHIELLFQGGQIKGEEYTAVRKDGSRFSISVHASPIIDHGKITGATGIAIDISQRKKLNAELTEFHRLRSELEKANIVSAAGQAAAETAHEIKNKLTSAMLNLSYLRRFVDTGVFDDPTNLVRSKEKGTAISLNKKDLDDSLRSIIDGIQELLSQANLLTKDMMSHSIPEMKIEESVNVNHILRNVAIVGGTVASSRQVKINFALAFERNLQTIPGDPDQIHRIMVNLVLNAIDAMPDGGTLTIKTANISNEQAKGIKISISDTGHGMSTEVKESIFKPSPFSTKVAGNGLGLPITWKMVKNHGGTITVYSEVNEGTTFEIILPEKGYEMRPTIRPPL